MLTLKCRVLTDDCLQVESAPADECGIIKTPSVTFVAASRNEAVEIVLDAEQVTELHKQLGQWLKSNKPDAREAKFTGKL